MNCCRTSSAAGGAPNSGDTTKVLIAEPSALLTVAECTLSEFSASTPAALDSRPRRSGAIIVTAKVSGESPGTISTCTAPSRAIDRCSAGIGSGCGSSSPANNTRQRRTSSPISVDFQSLQTPGPVASESASDRTANNSSNTGSPLSASTTPAAVAGSARSRWVAVEGSSRWWRTMADSSRTSEGHRPSRSPTRIARSAPISL